MKTKRFVFIGEFELPNAEREPTPEEIAEQERVAKERERNRLRYLKEKRRAITTSRKPRRR